MRPYTGRYAPSPTGRLHLGSLYAALASFLQARAQGAGWYLRIDDLDRPRVVAGAARDIIATLERFGLVWDGPVVYQSMRSVAYARAIGALVERNAAFPCACTRREARSGPPGLEGPIYPGTCREQIPSGRAPRTLRLRVTDTPVTCLDAIQGEYRQRLAADIGDFVIERADGVAAYQLATVIDDAEQGIGQVVRGADLLSSTPRQMALQQQLGLPTPRYAHLPVLVDRDGRKLGKSSGALALTPDNAARQLWDCLYLLNQGPPGSLAGASVAGLLHWGVDNWSLDRVPRQSVLDVTSVL